MTSFNGVFTAKTTHTICFTKYFIFKTQAFDEISPFDPELRQCGGHGAHFLPDLCISSSPLPIPCLAARCFLAVLFPWIPCRGLSGQSGDAALRFSQRVTNPTPFSSVILICLGPQSVVIIDYKIIVFV